jgi:hypothetical protein
MVKAMDAVVEQEVSKYPILVVHQEQLNIGLHLVNRKDAGGNWSIRISTLEEFVSKKLIEEKKVDSFRTIYKDRKKYLCLFVLSELGAQFVYMPRKSLEAK